MTTHVDEILLAGRDGERDAATNLYVVEHLRECGQCRELERRADRVDRVLATPEPTLPFPARAATSRTRSTLFESVPRAVVLGVAVVGAVALGVALREARQDRPPAASAGMATASAMPTLGPSRDLTATLASVALGISGDEVRAILGDPDQTSDIGRYWLYGRGLVVYFKSGPLEDPEHVTSVFALPGSGASTGEGFGIGGLEADFRAMYPAAAEVSDRPAIYYVIDPLRRGVLMRAEFDGLGRAVTLLVIEDDRPLVIPLRSLTVTSRLRPTAEPVRLPASEFRRQIEAEMRALGAQLGFRPLFPGRFSVGVEILLEDCGSARGKCIRLQWEMNGDVLDETRILQGPAGCCLDSARPYGDPRPDIEVRPGVFAEFIPLRPDEGDPLLWWIETTAPGSDVYVAISGPSLDRDELIEIARSMRPLE